MCVCVCFMCSTLLEMRLFVVFVFESIIYMYIMQKSYPQRECVCVLAFILPITLTLILETERRREGLRGGLVRKARSAFLRFQRRKSV